MTFFPGINDVQSYSRNGHFGHGYFVVKILTNPFGAFLLKKALHDSQEIASKL